MRKLSASAGSRIRSCMVLVMLLCSAVVLPIMPAHAILEIAKQSSQPVIEFLLVDSTTGQTSQTGQSSNVTIKISKNGATGASSAGVIAEVDSTNFPGVYSYTPATSETGTLGILSLAITCTGCQSVNITVQIVGFDPAAADIGLASVAVPGSPTAGTYGKAFSNAASQVNQTGDAYATATAINTKLGTPAGSSVSADIAALPGSSSIATAVWASATRTLTSFGSLTLAGSAPSWYTAPPSLPSDYLSSGEQTELAAVPTANQNAVAVWGSGTKAITNLPTDYLTSGEQTSLSNAAASAATASSSAATAVTNIATAQATLNTINTNVSALPSASAIATAVAGIIVDSNGSLTLKQNEALIGAALAGDYYQAPFNTGSHTQVTTYYKHDGVTILCTSTVQYATNNTTVNSRTTVWSNLP